MAEPKQKLFGGQFNTTIRSGTGKPESDGSAVYVRYKDHVLFKNIEQPTAEAMERETIGWLTKQDTDIILVEHDRTIPNVEIPSGSGSGLIILKNCIIEIRKLLLQKTSDCHLNPQKTTKITEYALQPKKRKTHNKQNATGANQWKS
jgi:hypothetical protein